jgi:protease-4
MRDFFKYTFASLFALVLFVTLGCGGLIFLLITLSVASRGAVPRVEDKTILTFDLSTDITDSTLGLNPGEVVRDAFAGDQPSQSIALRTVLDALETAAKDDRIVGLYLYGNINPAGRGSGLATMTEVRQALEAFQDVGKPIHAYEAIWSEQDYYLISIADTIALNPSGVLEINGYSSEAIFFTGALQKYGIGIQTVRSGRYKSFVEQFTRTSRSSEEQQQTRKLLTDLWNNFLSAVSESRDLTPQELQAIADQQGLLLPQVAKEAGLIDQVAYFDQILPNLKKLTEETEKDSLSRQISLSEYAETLEREESFSRNQIALVYAEGTIVNGEGGPGLIGGDSLARQVRELRLDDTVKAIVLRVNSAGGSAVASEQVAREVQLTRKIKPVVVSMGSLAASGGYEISTYANKIFASPTTITGSIGVFGLLPNIQELGNNNGITWDVVKTGRLADGDTITRPKTAEELALIQRVVDQVYDRFLAIVAESRSLPQGRVAEIAQGRVWSGIEAQRIGLVDELGGLEDAIQAAVDLAKLGDQWQIEEYPKPSTLGEQLENLFSSQPANSASFPDPLTVELQKLREELKILQALNDPLGVYTRLPFIPRIN